MRNYFRKFTLLTLTLFILATFSVAQDKKFPEPREEVLLNDLKVLIWSKPNTGRITVKLRIHSGAAFDPQNKEGVMAMLTEILFPEEGIKTFFEEDLEGKLEIITTHDYVQINTTAKSSEFLAVMETLSSSISKPQIDKETFAKIKPRHLKKLNELEKDPNYIADQAVAKRLYGNYPYGRPVNGTKESINNLDFADLIFANQRFLTADNATLSISGDVKSNYAYRASRRLFGGWQKSLKKIPANFRIPATPDAASLTVNVDEQDILLDRFAMEYASRKDKDYFASEILTEILNKRFKKISKQNGLKKTYVESNSNYLRGNIVFAREYIPNKITKIGGFVVDGSSETEIQSEEINSNKFITNLFTKKIIQQEFDSAKTKILTKLNGMTASDFWFDIYTYNLDSIVSELKKANDISLSGVQKLAMKLSKNKIVQVNVQSVAEPVVAVEKVETPIKKQDDDPKDPLK